MENLMLFVCFLVGAALLVVFVILPAVAPILGL